MNIIITDNKNSIHFDNFRISTFYKVITLDDLDSGFFSSGEYKKYNLFYIMLYGDFYIKKELAKLPTNVDCISVVDVKDYYSPFSKYFAFNKNTADILLYLKDFLTATETPIKDYIKTFEKTVAFDETVRVLEDGPEQIERKETTKEQILNLKKFMYNDKIGMPSCFLRYVSPELIDFYISEFNISFEDLNTFGMTYKDGKLSFDE